MADAAYWVIHIMVGLLGFVLSRVERDETELEPRSGKVKPCAGTFVRSHVSI